MASRRSTRRTAVALATSAVCVVLSVPGFAGAAESLLGRDAIEKAATDAVTGATDTVEDTVESVLDATGAQEATAPVTDRVTDAVKPATDPIKDILDPVTDAVDQVTKPATDTVDKVTKPVTDTVADPTKPVDDTVAPPGDDSAGGTTGIAGGKTGTSDRRSRGQRNTAAPAGGKQRAAPQQRLRGPRPVVPVAEPGTAVVSPRSKQIAAVDRSAVEVVADASRAFRFPLLLIAAVALFLAAQSRIDRRDPKLSAGADEELSFA